MGAAVPDQAFFDKKNRDFDARGINADQIVDSSQNLLKEAEAAPDIELDRATLAVLGRQLSEVNRARLGIIDKYTSATR